MRDIHVIKISGSTITADKNTIADAGKDCKKYIFGIIFSQYISENMPDIKYEIVKVLQAIHCPTKTVSSFPSLPLAS